MLIFGHYQTQHARKSFARILAEGIRSIHTPLDFFVIEQFLPRDHAKAVANRSVMVTVLRLKRKPEEPAEETLCKIDHSIICSCNPVTDFMCIEGDHIDVLTQWSGVWRTIKGSAGRLAQGLLKCT